MSYGSPPGWDDMTHDQQQLLFRIQEAGNYGCWPRELRDELIAADAPADDKAAVAVFLGGPGAGQEFAS